MDCPHCGIAFHDKWMENNLETPEGLACEFSWIYRATVCPECHKTTIVLATAHPANFPETIIEAIGEEPRAEALEMLKDRPIVKYHIAADKASIQSFIGEHSVN